MLNYQLNFHASSQYSFEPPVNYFTTYHEEDNHILDIEGVPRILFGSHSNWFKPFMLNNVKYNNVNQTNCYAHYGKYKNTIWNSRSKDIMIQTVLYMCIHIKTGQIVIATFSQIQYFPHLFIDYLIQRINSFPKKIQHLREIIIEMKDSGNNLGQVIGDSIVCKIAFFNRIKRHVLEYMNRLAITNQELEYLFNCFPNYDYSNSEQVSFMIKHECYRRWIDLETIYSMDNYVTCKLFNIGRDGFAGDIYCWFVNRLNKIPLNNNLDVRQNHISVFYEVNQLDAVLGFVDDLEVFLQDALFFEQAFEERTLVNTITEHYQELQ
jgi:hypothetical protein